MESESNFIVKITPNQRVFRTIKKKVNFVFYLIGSTKGAIPIDLFTDTAAIFNFIGFKEYYDGMPRGHEPDPIYSDQYLCALFGPIFR